MKTWKAGVGGLGAAGLCFGLWLTAAAWYGRSAGNAAPKPGAIPLAVLGDSDSHAYHDPWRERARGGDHHAVTFQWTEVLERLRPGVVDLGEFGAWGVRRRWVALGRLIGLHPRLRAKQDFLFNFASDGARCRDLTEGPGQQLGPLLGLMDEDREGWASGAVLIRIGVNDLFRTAQMEERRAVGLDPVAEAEIDACARHIGTAIRRIRERNPDVLILVSGLFDELAAPPTSAVALAPSEVRNVRDLLDRFDDRMRNLVAGDARAAWLDERTWWREAWGAHDVDTGEPLPRSVSLGGPTPVTNSVGDHPRHAVLEDGHAGTVVNAMWANHLIDALAGFGLSVPPLEMDEIASLVDPDGTEGLAPPGPTGER